MYLDTPVPVPDVPGKVTFVTKSGATYVSFEYDRVYDPVRKYTIAKRSAIGKLVDPEDHSTMLPNENYVKYFASELPKDCAARRKEELWAAVLESDLSFDEILAMIKGTKAAD